MMHELQDWESAIFVTLTYTDEQLLIRSNYAQSLVKEDLRNFFKRLRKNLEPRRIKYYGIGEYGDKDGRPHYHAVIFGLDFDEHKVQRFLSRKGNPTWLVVRGPALTAWSPHGICIGNVHIGTVTHQSTKYVSSYLHKKYNGNMLEYYGKDRIQPFSFQSQGLGKGFAVRNMEQIVEAVGCLQRGNEVGIPKYYVRKFEEIMNPHDFEEFKQAIKQKAVERQKEEVNRIAESGEIVLNPLASEKKYNEVRQRLKNAEAKDSMFKPVL